MIKIKSTLSKSDKKRVQSIIFEIPDYFGDFYLTQNNLRLSIKDNLQSLYKLLKAGDFILFDEGVIGVIIGYSEHAPRKYVKILAQDEKAIDMLAKNINWNFSEELYCKIKENNLVKKVLLRNRWKYFGNRGKEILLKREAIELPKKLGEIIEK